MRNGNASLARSLMVWWRFGKEHGGGALQVNSPEVVAAHLDQKINRARSVPKHEWRWWQVDESLLIEQPDPNGYGYGRDTRIYYLIQQGLAVIENIYLPAPREEWQWYIHLADIFYDGGRACWIKQDLFCDVVIASDLRRHRVLDLADLGEALDLGLVSPAKSTEILRRTDSLLAAVAAGSFPFPLVVEGQAVCRQMGW